MDEQEVKKLVETLYYQTQEKQALKKTLQEITAQNESERTATLEMLKKYSIMKKRYRKLKVKFSTYVGVSSAVGAIVLSIIIKYVL